MFWVFGRAESREERPPAFSHPSTLCLLGCMGKSGGERGPAGGHMKTLCLSSTASLVRAAPAGLLRSPSSGYKMTTEDYKKL